MLYLDLYLYSGLKIRSGCGLGFFFFKHELYHYVVFVHMFLWDVWKLTSFSEQVDGHQVEHGVLDVVDLLLKGKLQRRFRHSLVLTISKKSNKNKNRVKSEFC